MKNESVRHMQAEKIFNHEPSEMEMIYFMAEHGLGRYDYCSIDVIFRMED